MIELNNIKLAKKWLSESAIPLWMNRGIDKRRGGFFESLNLKGEPTQSPRRVMVQARQIYSAHTAMIMGVLDTATGTSAIQQGVDFILKHYSLASGAFSHSIDENFKPSTKTPDLYAQAFVLLGLAHAYEVLKIEEYKIRALKLLDYLNRERKLTQGGYSEFLDQKLHFEANPHMHLFEALIAWMEYDSQEPKWSQHAAELSDLCTQKFIDAQTYLLAEHFDSKWEPLRTQNTYIFEPGHMYEWIWLLGNHQKLSGRSYSKIRMKMFDVSESYGLHKERKSVYDEVRSDLTPHKMTSRFWPQCERIKASLQLGLENEHKEPFARAADEAFSVLFKFFEVEISGLWFDCWLETGAFTQDAAKASSLYHIIAALRDYVRFRELLTELSKD